MLGCRLTMKIPPKNPPTILDRLREGTEARSDSELARLLGVSQQAVSNARASNKVPDSWVRKAAEQFKLSTDWLFFGWGNKKVTSLLGAYGDLPPRRASSEEKIVVDPPTIKSEDAKDARIRELEAQLAEARDAERRALQKLVAVYEKTGPLIPGLGSDAHTQAHASYLQHGGIPHPPVAGEEEKDEGDED